MAKRYEHLEKALCNELEKLDKKYSADIEMSEADAERADMLYHALKSAETYYAMVDAGDEDGESSRSHGSPYARTRESRTGRYMPREMEPDWYEDERSGRPSSYWGRR